MALTPSSQSGTIKVSKKLGKKRKKGYIKKNKNKKV